MELDSNNENGESLKIKTLEKTVSDVEVKISSEDSKRYPEKTERLAVIIEMHNDVNPNPLKESPSPQQGDPDIKSVLKGLGFNIEICDAKNQTKKELPNYLQNIKGKITKETDCFILVLTCVSADENKKNEFMTRDENGLCRSADKNKLSLWNDVVEKFNNENCKELINVPKIFVLQLFRDPIEKDNPATPSEKKLDPNSKLPTWTDMLVCNSKIYKPSKDSHPVKNPPIVGSKFMEFFCKALQERGRGNDICKLLDAVSEMMKVQMTHQRQRATNDENEFSQYYNIGFSKAYRFPLNPPPTL